MLFSNGEYQLEEVSLNIWVNFAFKYISLTHWTTKQKRWNLIMFHEHLFEYKHTCFYYNAPEMPNLIKKRFYIMSKANQTTTKIDSFHVEWGLTTSRSPKTSYSFKINVNIVLYHKYIPLGWFLSCCLCIVRLIPVRNVCVFVQFTWEFRQIPSHHSRERRINEGTAA